MCSLLSPLIMSFGHVFTFVTTYVIWAYVPFCHHLLCDLVMCSFCHYLLCHLVMCSFLSPLMSFDNMFPFCHHLLCHLIMCSLLSLLIMSSGHRFPFVITYYVIWPCVPFLSPLMSFGHMFPFCNHLLCHLIMCSFLSLLIMSSDHLFPFVITYYVIWSYVPFCHYLLCHLVIWSLFHHLLCHQVMCSPLSLLIMSSGHMFPFCHHLLCHLAMCSLLSPLIMYSGHMFPFVTTCQVAIYHVTSCKSLLLCQVAICYATFKSYEVMWPYATLSYAALVTFIMSSGHMLCYLSSSLFIYNSIEIVICIWYTGKLYI